MTETIRGREPLSPRVVTVEPLPDRKLLLSFANGEKRCFDAMPLLKYQMKQNWAAVSKEPRD